MRVSEYASVARVHVRMCLCVHVNFSSVNAGMRTIAAHFTGVKLTTSGAGIARAGAARVGAPASYCWPTRSRSRPLPLV